MVANQSFYCSDSDYLARSERRIERAAFNGILSPEDVAVLNRYLVEKDANGITPSRHLKLATTLVNLKPFIPEFTKCTLADIQKAFNDLRYARRAPRPYEKTNPDELPLTKQNTVGDRQRILKSFMIWLCDNGLNKNIDVRKLEKLRPVKILTGTVTEDDIFTEEELQAFFRECRTIRDKALFNVMYEGALRVGDLGNLQFKDLKITDTYCSIRTAHKTGIERIVPIFSSKAYLTDWINAYPKANHTPDDFVFLNSFGRPLSQAAVARQTKEIAQRANIKKSIHPHIFRHTRITMLSRAGLDEAKVKLLAWGNQTTKMMAVYNHLTAEDLANSLADLQGIETPGDKNAKKKELLKPIQCHRCGFVNPPGLDYCHQCHSPLTKNGKEDLEQLVFKVLEMTKGDPGALAAVFSDVKKME